MSIDPLLSRVRRPDYTCMNLADEAWQMVAGRSLREEVAGRRLRRLARPADPCVVIMRSPGVEAHVGVFVRGRVLHLADRYAKYDFLDVASFGFNDVRFYG